jgi:phospholipid/cholesterol/gamma-HCH transport system permease protein
VQSSNTGLVKNMKLIQEQNKIAGYLQETFVSTGEFTHFTGRFFKELFRPPYFPREFIKQSFQTGYKSLPLVALTSFIIGLVMTLQSRPSLVEFGAESLLPGMISNSIIKEIGPVITALLCAGKIGSGIGAELGSMRVTEQIDALEVSAINPYKYLVVTRVLATTLMVPLLIIFSDMIGLYGSYIAMNIHTDIGLRRFYTEALIHINFFDVFPALIKSFFFGFFIGIIGCYKGYHAKGGTESVGRAANSAVVSASLAVFVLDMIAVQITDLL